MRIDVLTLFPEMFAPMEQSMMKRAIEKEKINRPKSDDIILTKLWAKDEHTELSKQ